MIERDEILAQMGRRRLTVAALSRSTGITQPAIRAFLNGGDAKVSSVEAIVGAVGGQVGLFFDQARNSTFVNSDQAVASDPTPAA